MRTRVTASPLLLSLLAVAVNGCAPAAEAPLSIREGTLAAEGVEPLPKDLRVVHAGPKGEVGSGEAPSVVFDRAVRVVADEASEAAPPVRLEPRVAGTWRWLGSQAATFEPTEPYPGSTRFVVRVEPSFAAIDGARLSAPFEHAFESPRIRVQTASIADDDLRVLDVQGAIRVRLTQRATVDAFVRSGRFEEGGRAIGVRAALLRGDGEPERPDGTLFFVKPSAPFTPGARVSFELDAGFVGAEGPLSMGEAFRQAFDVIGEPHLTEPPCSESDAGACAAGASIHLAFDAPVSVKELKAHLRVDPPRELRWPKQKSALDRVQLTHWLGAEFKPGEAVTLTLTRGLTNKFGRRLEKPIVAQVRFAPPKPFATVAFDGTYVDASAAPKTVVVPTQALSEVDTFTVPLARPDALAVLDQDAAKALAGPPWSSFLRTRKITWELGDTSKRGSVDLALPSAPAWLGVRYRDASGGVRIASRLVVPARRMLSAHVGFEGGVVWATDFVKGTPEASVTVAVIEAATGREVARGITGRDGRVVVPALPAREDGLAGYVIVALDPNGAIETLTRFDAGHWHYAYGVPTDTSPRRPIHAVLETDRDVYRPGDTVALSAVLREVVPLGLRTPAGRAVKLTAIDDRDEHAFEKVLTVSAFGTLHERIEVPAHTPLGAMRFVLEEVDGAKEAIGVLYVRIEHARPAEFQVKLDARADRIVAGEPIAVRGSGRYLYGAPMAGLPVRFVVGRERSASVLAEEGEPRPWISGNEALRNARRDGRSIDGVVLERASESDREGAATLEEILDLATLEDDERITVEAEYKDLTGRVGAGRTAVRAFSSTRRVFLREPSESVLRPKKALAYGVRVVDMTDKDVDAATVDLRLLRYVDRTAKRTSADGKTIHEELVREESEVDRCAAKSSAQRRGCALTPREAGQHVVEATTRDSQGRVSRSSFFVWVSEPRDSALFAEGEARDLELVVGAPTYKPGDTAKVLVKNPWPGSYALVTVEREGVRRSEVRKLGAADTVEVPVDATMVPEVHVGVHLVRPRVGSNPEGGEGERLARVGITTLRVENPARELRVSVTTGKASYDPGGAVEGELRVVDSLGQPVRAEVTVSAVDEGMILLTGHEPPNVASAIDAYRPLAQQVVEPRFRMARFASRLDARARSAAFAEKGAEGGDGAVRSDFTPLAAFVTGLVTDAEGRARFSFTLPDTLTRYRLQVLAVGEGDRYGHGKGTFEVKKALMVRPFLPRVLRIGDDARASVAVQGPALSGPFEAGVDVAGGLVASVSGARMLREGIGATLALAIGAHAAGDARITLRASQGGARDTIALPLRVAEPRFVERFATFGEASGAIVERIGDLGRFDPAGSRLDVDAFGSPFVGLAPVLDGVEAYPYDCSEQLASKLLARLAFAGLQRKLGAAGAVDAAGVAAIVRTLAGRQDYSGLVPYWSGYEGDDVLSAYVLEVLARAAREGYPVSAGALVQLRRALTSRLREATGDRRAYLLASIADARGDGPDVELAQAIASALAASLADRAKLEPSSRAQLLRAAVALGAPPEIVSALRTEVVDTVRVTGLEASVITGERGWLPVDRSLSATAHVLRALAASDPHHRLVAPLGRTLVRASLQAKWPNPREVALALAALERSASVADDSAREVIARIGDVRRALPLASPLASAHGSFSLAEVPRGGAPLELRGAGRYGYRVVLHAMEARMPTTPVDRGLHVERAYRFLLPGELERFEKREVVRAPSSRGRLGELVSIERIVVNASPLDHVVLDDPLPGAFEVIDRSFETESRYGTSDVGDEERRGSWFDTPLHVERLPDRVRTVWQHLPPGVHRVTTLARVAFSGSFVAPPASAEAMYEPDVRGRSAATTILIEDR
jgi:uncharacterized protein YfaS (alpha-2-macroglobulin family)